MEIKTYDLTNTNHIEKSEIFKFPTPTCFQLLLILQVLRPMHIEPMVVDAIGKLQQSYSVCKQAEITEGTL